MKSEKENFYVITGGPGVGKSTLIKALDHYGFQIVKEDARTIIKNQIESGKEGVPWKNKEVYAKLMIEASIKSYEQVNNAENTKLIFFDRGILDAICYMKMEHIPIPKEITQLAKQYSYNKNVFLLPPWKEIYETDKERKQDWNEAELTFGQIKSTYIEFGYDLIEVPKITTEERLKFILKHIVRR